MGIVVLLFIGLLASILGSLVGIGGGLVIVPSLLFLGNYTGIISELTPQMAVGSSMLVVLTTGLSSTFAYMKLKRVDYQSGLIFLLGSGPGAALGAYINHFFKVESFSIIFGIFIIFISVFMVYRHRLKGLSIKRTIQKEEINEKGEVTTYGYSLKVAIPISFFVGGVSGLFGIGGGAIMVPVMVLIFMFSPHRAVATSMFMIFLSSIIGSLVHILMGNVHWVYVSFLIIGALIGGQIGARINNKLKSNSIILIFRIILIIIGLRLIWDGMSPYLNG